MEQIKYAGFPSLLGEIEAQLEEIDRALKRTLLMLGGIVLPCAGLILYVLASAGK